MERLSLKDACRKARMCNMGFGSGLMGNGFCKVFLHARDGLGE